MLLEEVDSTRDGVTGKLVLPLAAVPTSVLGVPPALEEPDSSTVTSCIKGVLGVGADPCSTKLLTSSVDLVRGRGVTVCIPTPLVIRKLLMVGCFNLVSLRMVLGGVVVVVVSGTRFWLGIGVVTPLIS